MDQYHLPLRYYDGFHNLKQLGSTDLIDVLQPDGWNLVAIYVYPLSQSYEVWINGENIGTAQYGTRETGARGFKFLEVGGDAPCEPNYLADGYYDDIIIKQWYSDCNSNGTPDSLDISSGSSYDSNDNGICDECEQDCNGNSILDDCDIDCTAYNGGCNVPGCGLSVDVNINGIPDECETDCNGNGLPDEWEIENGLDDCDGNGIPDECQFASHNCCETGHGPGCSNPAIVSWVCLIDPYCCEVEWDEACATRVFFFDYGLCNADMDEDGILDVCDNFDTDNEKNCCDSDDDNDGIPDEYDNCPLVWNLYQSDFDRDGIGHCCDDDEPFAIDVDGDGVDDLCDSFIGSLEIGIEPLNGQDFHPGDWIQYEVWVTNHSTAPIPMTASIYASSVSSWQIPLFGPFNFTIPAQTTIGPVSFQNRIPPGAPPMTVYICARVNDVIDCYSINILP
jgi:hypothetical protein